MARPRKEGMDYFPHDVHMSTDKKVKALRIMYGNDGYTFFNIALEMIYQEPNFELDISDAETIQILASNVEVTTQKLLEMISTAVKHGCFDKERYTNDGVLTSNGILKRADVVTKKRIAMRDKYDNKVSDAETPPETPQSKRKVKDKVTNKKPSSPKRVYDEQSLEYRSASYLYTSILSFKPDLKKPDLQKWSNDMRLLMEADKKTPAEIARVIDWATKDPFWQVVTLSASGFREKWDKITAKMNQKVVYFKNGEREAEASKRLADERKAQKVEIEYAPAVDEVVMSFGGK